MNSVCSVFLTLHSVTFRLKTHPPSLEQSHQQVIIPISKVTNADFAQHAGVFSTQRTGSSAYSQKYF